MVEFIDIFAITQRPDVHLFYQRHDPNDIRLGERVSHHPDSYVLSDVVLLGCPQDEGVRRNGGRTGAARAPDEIRRYFYRLTIAGLEHLRLFDLGNTRIQDTLENTHTVHQQIVRQVVQTGKRLIVLGGGNDISYADCSGLAQASSDVLAFNVDAHYDVRADAVRNSGTPYRQLLDENFIQPAQFYEIGSQPFANSPVYRRYLQEKGVYIVPLSELRTTGIKATFQQILSASSAQAIFWGLDMDVVRAADAPGVSAPNPAGMTGDELCEIARLAGQDARSRLLEISEVNPAHDIDGRTCRLAAVVMYHFLTGIQS